MMHPDQKYIKALLENDEPLIEELYSKYSAKIRWMILKNNGTDADAADIFQDALLSLFNKAKDTSFELTCPLDAFLYLICRNKWMNELSKRKAHRVTFLDAEGYSRTGEDVFKLAEEFGLKEARKHLLLKKLAQLGEGCRKLLRLSWEGKSMEEVAAILNVTYGYARKKKSECMSKLVALVKDSPDFNSLKW